MSANTLEDGRVTCSGEIDEPLDVLAEELSVTIDGDHQVRPSLQSRLQRSHGAWAVAEISIIAQDFDWHAALSARLDYIGGTVRGLVIHHDVLRVSAEMGRQLGEEFRDAASLVVGGHDDDDGSTHARRLSLRYRSARIGPRTS